MATRNLADLGERAVAAAPRAWRDPWSSTLTASTLAPWSGGWRARRCESLADRPRPGRPTRVAPGQRDALAARMATAPDATQDEHRAAWEGATKVRVSRSAMARELAQRGLTLKRRC